MTTPVWASELVEKVCSDYGLAQKPEIRWQSSKGYRFRDGFVSKPRHHSSGSCIPSRGRIFIRAGSDLMDQRITLLHELAHWMCPDNEHHSAAFWDQAFQLFDGYEVNLDVAKERSCAYKKKALKVFERNLVEGREIVEMRSKR